MADKTPPEEMAKSLCSILLGGLNAK
ncbi:hypothetical protein [Aromatoleum sp.]